MTGSRPRMVPGPTKPPSQVTLKIGRSGSTGVGDFEGGALGAIAPAVPTHALNASVNRRSAVGRAIHEAARNTGWFSKLVATVWRGPKLGIRSVTLPG